MLEYNDWFQVTAGAPYCARYWLCRVTTWLDNESIVVTNMKIRNEYLQLKQPTVTVFDIGCPKRSSNVEDERDDCGSNHGKET